MNKKIAVIVRDRQAESLRMALGLTLENDEVSVFLMDRELEMSEANTMSMELLNELEVSLFTNISGNTVPVKTTEEIALSLAGYDHIVPC